MFIFSTVNISGKIVLPIIGGGKGIGVSNGVTAGTFPQILNENGDVNLDYEVNIILGN